jgi:linoleoyl-CoA desaturase
MLDHPMPAFTPAKYLPRGQFSVELREQVELYFSSRNLSKRDMPAMYRKTIVVLAWLGLSYAGLLAASAIWQGISLSLSLGLAMAAVGFNIMHDGSHGAYSSRPWVNRLMARSLDLLGGSAYFWKFKHLIAHHTYTNISGQDDDINLSQLGRLSPHAPWRRAFRFQHIYLWAFYALIAIEWQTTGELRNLISRRRIGLTAVPFPGRREHLLFWAGKLVFFCLAFAVPLLVHPWPQMLACYAITAVTLGFVLAVVFQLAHCLEEAHFEQPTVGDAVVNREWAAHQAEATVNFAPHNRLVTWYLGGLNYQIEHHLFPGICHVHYPALAPVVESVCRKYGVRHFSHPTVAAAVRSHARWLRKMGCGPVAEAHAPTPARRAAG